MGGVQSDTGSGLLRSRSINMCNNNTEKWSAGKKWRQITRGMEIHRSYTYNYNNKENKMTGFMEDKEYMSMSILCIDCYRCELSARQCRFASLKLSILKVVFQAWVTVSKEK